MANTIKINKVWAMPNKNTFKIKAINELIKKYTKPNLLTVDAFNFIRSIVTVEKKIN